MARKLQLVPAMSAPALSEIKITRKSICKKMLKIEIEVCKIQPMAIAVNIASKAE